MVRQRPASVLFTVAGDFVRIGADLPFLLPRRIIDLKHANLRFPRRDGGCQSPRARYQLRLFRSREPALEFLATYGG